MVELLGQIDTLREENKTLQEKVNALDEENKTLKEFTRDLTADARAGKLDPVIGRAEEIERVIHILNRRQKNNP